jgi:hypothetical protein
MRELTMQENKQYKTLYSKIEKVLADDPDSRNSDKRLFLEIVRRWYSEGIHDINTSRGRKAFILLEEIFQFPYMPDITRIRRKIQNYEKRFIPTSWEVAQFRRWKEEDWKSAIGYYKEPAEQLKLW